LSGYFADEVAANSSWTRGHMDELWNKGSNIDTLYPPCNTSDFIKKIDLDLVKNPRENHVISFAQFRPEKDHMLQLAVWKECLDTNKMPADAKFIMIGTVRGPED